MENLIPAGQTPQQIRADLAQVRSMLAGARSRGDAAAINYAERYIAEANARLLRYDLSLTETGRAVLAKEDDDSLERERRRRRLAEADALGDNVLRGLAATETGRKVLRDKYGITNATEYLRRRRLSGGTGNSTRVLTY